VPAYDFICGGCGTFELRRPIEDAAAPATCPDVRRAGTAPVRRTRPPPGAHGPADGARHGGPERPRARGRDREAWPTHATPRARPRPLRRRARSRSRHDALIVLPTGAFLAYGRPRSLDRSTAP
jgi:putative FmdB family regulatory protein